MPVDRDCCPHCGSDDYGPVNEGNEHCCLVCGYDTENGTTGVCPGGMHPKDGQVCCDDCWDRAPRTFNGQPWRRRRRSLIARTWKYDSTWRELEKIDATLRAWLADHPRETSNP